MIYLFMSGGPSHIDLFDHKPKLTELHRRGTARTRCRQRPADHRHDQRPGQAAAWSARPTISSAYGSCGAEITECCRTSASIADDIAIVRSMHTDPINHDPAVTFLLTGNQQPGRPTLGSWLSYGLGSENKNLPEFVVLLSGGGGQPLLSRYWGNGFLPSKYQGVQFRSTGRPGALRLESRRASTRPRAAQLLDGVQRAQPACSSKPSATRRSPRASTPTRWPIACRPACPS